MSLSYFPHNYPNRPPGHCLNLLVLILFYLNIPTHVRRVIVCLMLVQEGLMIQNNIGRHLWSPNYSRVLEALCQEGVYILVHLSEFSMAKAFWIGFLILSRTHGQLKYTFQNKAYRKFILSKLNFKSKKKKIEKLVELVGGGSVINGAYPV